MTNEDDKNSQAGSEHIAVDNQTDTSTSQGTTSAEELVTGGDKDSMSNDEWQRDVINRLAFAAINEQRRARRWGRFPTLAARGADFQGWDLVCQVPSD